MQDLGQDPVRSFKKLHVLCKILTRSFNNLGKILPRFWQDQDLPRSLQDHQRSFMIIEDLNKVLNLGGAYIVI